MPKKMPNTIQVVNTKGQANNFVKITFLKRLWIFDWHLVIGLLLCDWHSLTFRKKGLKNTAKLDAWKGNKDLTHGLIKIHRGSTSLKQ